MAGNLAQQRSIGRLLKDQLLGARALRDGLTWARRRRLHDEYVRRRDDYWRRARAAGFHYDEAGVKRLVRERLAARSYTPARRAMGEIHTFASFPTYGWHKHLLPDLRELGPVTHFDYAALGFDVERMAVGDARGVALRREMLRHFVPAFKRAHAERPVDWIFCYGGGQDTSPVLIRQIQDEFGVPAVDMSLDDKQGFVGRPNDECRAGAVDITAAFDLFVTQARECCDWHFVEGGRPLYMPEGFDASAYGPRDSPVDIPISFVGNAYGYRRSVIEDLRRAELPVRTFGGGWPDAGWIDDIISVFARSQINLGFGGIEYSEWLTNVKGRDFEIPGTGGGVYVTSFNPDLAQHFVVGEEILCYRGREEMVELLRYYLDRPDDCRRIAARARARALREHRWLHRYQKVLAVLGVIGPVQ